MLPEIALSTGLIAWISALISIAIGLAVKDLLTTSVSGFLFWLDRNFNEGDEVYIDGEKAIIVRIGFRQTVFGIDNGRGYTWRFVYNHRISHMKLEKVIIKAEIQHVRKNKNAKSISTDIH